MTPAGSTALARAAAIAALGATIITGPAGPAGPAGLPGLPGLPDPAGPPTRSAAPAALARVDNPFVGLPGYVNPVWRANAETTPAGRLISDNPTAVWLDGPAAIEDAGGGLGLRDHLDLAVRQGAGYAQFVVNGLPGLDCLSPTAPLSQPTFDLTEYQTAFIDPIAAALADPAYAQLRIVLIVEPWTLPVLLVGGSARRTPLSRCRTPEVASSWVAAIQHALNRFNAAENSYPYLDASNHAWIGWETLFAPSVDLLARMVRGTTAGLSSVVGFAIDVAGYNPLREPFLVVTDGTRRSRWIDWNTFTEELPFAQALRTKLVSAGFAATIGMVIDTSRSGWGGPARPTRQSPAAEANTFVDESRVDRRIHKGNWCNQAGAGLGERPVAQPAAGIDAYIWAKPPGESDGSPIGTATAPANLMCDPDYPGTDLNANNLSGALPGGPARGAWFPEHFRQLLANAYPPLDR